ncbi:MAG: hypothetical protein IPK01_08355 [Acidobacteria bacterium]|nr:hypothetical protein [Acidobacteriota bacterium]
MDNDTVGDADRTVDEIEKWAPGLPVFGQLTPFPATPLYDRLEAAGRLKRPKHWLDFAPFVMAHDPLKMSIEDAKRKHLLHGRDRIAPNAILRRSIRSVMRRSTHASVTLWRGCSSAGSISRK